MADRVGASIAALRLEVNELHADPAPLASRGILITPAIGESYWLFRVQLTPEQAILGFEKFGTIGIGFAKEADWNTNLPYTCDAAEIWDHIKENKGDKAIRKPAGVAAIKLIQEAAHHLRQTEPVVP